VAAAGDRRSLRGRLICTIYVLCLLGATYNHAASIHRHGPFWTSGIFPEASAVFWTALVILDPTAVILLFVRPNAGIAATAAIIITDVIHNMWIEARYFPPLLRGLAQSPQLLEQIAFMIFVAATAPAAWRGRSEVPRHG